MADSQLAMLGNDSGVEQRYLDTFRRSEPLEREKALLLAILEDAIHCYRKFAGSRSRAGRKQFREAEQWLMGGGDRWVFAFDSVCELLGLDQEYVRRGLRESVVRPTAENSDPPRSHTRHRQAA